MGLSTGNYSRNMFNEEDQYLWAKVQQGIPWIDSDENDCRLSLQTQIRRVAQMIGCGAIGNGWKITADGTSPFTFYVTGGDDTLDGAGRFILNGHVSLLREPLVSYDNGGLTQSQLEIHPRITNIVYDSSTDQTSIEDSAANWEVNEHVGKSVYPDVTSAYNTTVVSNTSNVMIVSGDATTSGEKGSHYRIHLTNTSGRTDGVFLNVYVDDYGAADDPNLEHQLAVPVEAQRRAKLIHTIYVKEGSESFPNYVDMDGNQHYTYQLARIYRNGGDLTDGHIEDLRQVIIDDIGCDYTDTKWLNSTNLCPNGSFDTSCGGYLTDGGMFLDRTWGFWTESGGSVEKIEGEGPDGSPCVTMITTTGKGQLYNSLSINSSISEHYPVSVGVDIRFTTLSSNTSYAGTSPLGLPYSGRILYGSSVYYIYNPSSLGTWKRISVPFPVTPQDYPQISIEFGPGVTASVARVSAIVGSLSAIPPIPSGKAAFYRPDTVMFTQTAPSDTWTVLHRTGCEVPVFHVWDDAGISLHERYDRVEFVDRNTLKVYFDEPLAGKVVIAANVCSGSPARFFTGITSYNTSVIPNAEAYAFVTTADDAGNLIEYSSAKSIPDNRLISVLTTPPYLPLETQIIAAIDKIHHQTTADATWNIQHNLNTLDVIVRCYDAIGDAIPGIITIVDYDNIRFDCDYPMAGYAAIKAHSVFPQYINS